MLTLFAKRKAGQILNVSVGSVYTITNFILVDLFDIEFELFNHFTELFNVAELAYFYIELFDIEHFRELCMESGARTVNELLD